MLRLLEYIASLRRDGWAVTLRTDRHPWLYLESRTKDVVVSTVAPSPRYALAYHQDEVRRWREAIGQA